MIPRRFAAPKEVERWFSAAAFLLQGEAGVRVFIESAARRGEWR
ncbi:MAG: hypothetical protein WDN46_22615 [Methylocella sp.]